MERKNTKWINLLLSICLIFSLLIGLFPQWNVSAATAQLIPNGMGSFDSLEINKQFSLLGSATELKDEWYAKTTDSGAIKSDPVDATNKTLLLKGSSGSAYLYLPLPTLASTLSLFSDSEKITLKLSMKVYNNGTSKNAIYASLTKLQTSTTGATANNTGFNEVNVAPSKTSADNVWETLNFNLSGTAKALSAFNAMHVRLPWAGGDYLLDDISLTCEVPDVPIEISFETNGGSKINSISGEEGKKVVLPSNPTKDGFIFDGWYTDAEFTSAYTLGVFPQAPMTLYAKWSENTWTQDFETFLDSADSIITEPTGPKDSFEIVQIDEALSGKQVLRYKNETGVAWKYSGIVVNGGGNRAALNAFLKQGDSFEVSFKYKVFSGKAEMAVQVGPDLKNAYAATSSTGIADNRTALIHNEELADENGWQTYKGVFTLNANIPTEQVVALVLKIGNTSSTIVSELYIDDITVRLRSDLVKVTFDTNGGSELSPISGEAGAKIIYPSAPTKDGYAFDGWYLDANCTNLYTGSVYPTANTTLYAKWSENTWTQNFETFVDSADGVITEPDGAKDSFEVVQIDDAISGKQVLRYKNDSGIAWKYGGVVINGGGNRSALSVMLNPGDGIEVTFKYKVISGKVEMAVQVGPDLKNAYAATSSTGIADNRTKLAADTSPADENGWQTFKGIFILEDNVAAADIKALVFKMCNTSETVGAEIYIDDVNVRPRTDFVTITYETNGGDEIASMRGVPGAVLVLPTATGKEDYIFNGWFTEAEFKNGFTQKVYPEKDTTLYAKWLEAGYWEQNFETYDSTVNNHISGFELYKSTGSKDPLVRSGNYSMHKKAVTNSWLVLFPGQPMLEQGKAYEIEFWVYNKSTTSSAIYLTYLHEQRNSAWRPDDSDPADESARRTANIYSIASTDVKDEWIKVNVRFTAEYSMYLGIYTYGEYNDWYIDDVKLSEIEPGVITVDTKNTYAEDLYNELTKDPYTTALQTKTNTLQTLQLQLRGNEMYIFAGAVKNKDSYAYLSWDDKGENPIEPTKIDSKRIGYEFMTDITGIVYINIMNTSGKNTFDEMVLVRSKLSYFTQPPRASGKKISADSLMSLAELLKTERYAEVVAEMELDDGEEGYNYYDSPATGDKTNVTTALLLMLITLVVAFVFTKKRGAVSE